METKQLCALCKKECSESLENREPKVCVPCQFKTFECQEEFLCFLLEPTKLTKEFETVVGINQQLTIAEAQAELRCLDSKKLYTYKWPLAGRLVINKKLVKEFRYSNVSKKLEPSINITGFFSEKSCCSLSFHNKQEFNQELYICIVLVKQLSQTELLKKLQPKTKVSYQESHRALKNAICSENSEVTLERYNISLVCPFSKSRIVTPVRGSFCKHFQCFDLHNWIHSQNVQNLNIRWRCPICDSKVVEIQKDEFWEVVLKEYQEATSVSVEPDGTLFVPGEYTFEDFLNLDLGIKNLMSDSDFNLGVTKTFREILGSTSYEGTAEDPIEID